MKHSRRDFISLTGKAGLMVAGAGILPSIASGLKTKKILNKIIVEDAVAVLGDGTSLSVPYWRVDSGRDGPSLALIASQHGNEVQGAEVARRFADVCAAQLVSGSVWLIPMSNLLAVKSRRHSFNLEPEQNNRLNPLKLHNMQRHWPGNPRGNDTSRLAWALDQAALRHCSHLVDMHCWEHYHAAETLSESDHRPSREMSEVTTTRFISYRNTQIPETEPMMVSQMILKRGGSVVVMELSGQFQMQERQVRIGLSSMVNIAKHLGMIRGEPEKIKGPRAVHDPKTIHEVKTPCSGIFMSATRKNSDATLVPDDYVEEGQNLGHIISEKDLTVVPLRSPVSGYLWQYGLCHWSLCDASLPAQHPYADEGETTAVVIKT
jgi:predicted deacylase